MRFRLRDVSISVLFLIVMVLGVAAAGVTVADPSVSSDVNGMEPVEHTAADVEIAEELRNAEGEVEVIVRFESVDRATLQASDDAVETLKTKASTAQGPLQRYAARTPGVRVERDFWLANAALVTVDTGKVSLKELGRIDGVERIHENRKVPAASPAVSATGNRSTTAATGATWGLNRINASEVWENYGTKGEGSRVAVLDTGIDADHQDLDLYATDVGDPTYPGGWAEFDENGDVVSGSEPFDCGAHGTHTSGTVAGGDASGEHIGVAPGIELLHGGVLVETYEDGGCFGWESQVIGGMEWAVERNADVISMSLGGNRYSNDYADAVKNAEEAGVLVVASAGNSHEGNSSSPGNGYDSFAVGASNNFDNGIADFSSGELVYKSDFDEPYSSPPGHWPSEWIVPDVAAPGVNVCSTVPGGGHECYWSGTSMAAPHVAGTAALMESATSNDLSPAEMKRALEDSAWKPGGWDESSAQDSFDGKDTRYGLGIINAQAAVDDVSTGTFNGTVTDSGTGDPIAGATITAVNGSETYDATTASDGTFELVIDDDKIYDVTIEREGYDSVVETDRYVDHNGNVDLGSIGLAGNASLEGTVTDDVTGTALENATVTATDPETGVTYKNGTEANGAFAFDAVRGRVDYDLAVSARGYDETTVTVAIDDDASATANVGLAGDSTLAGTVTDRESGVELPNVSVAATSDAGTYGTATAGDGTYTFTLPGNETAYDLAIEADGYESWTGEEALNGGKVSLDATLTGDGNISLSLAEKHFEEAVAGASITVANETYGEYPVADADDGNYTVSNVSSAGTYEIVVEATGYETNTTGVETVPEGGTATHDVFLTGNATIEGTLTDAYGQTTNGNALPVENATIEVTRADASGALALANATDANGSYVAAVPGTDATYTVTAAAPYYEDAVVTTDTLGDNASTTVDVETVGNATLAGMVTVSGEQTANATINATTNAAGWENAAWVAETGEKSAAVSVPGTGAAYSVNATARGFDSDSTAVANVTGDDNFGTLSIGQLARYLGVDDLTAPDSVEEGDAVTVEATIVNLGTDSWNGTAAFHVDGTQQGSQNISLNGTDTASGIANATVSFTHETGDAGDVTYAIGTANETVNETVTVEESSGGGLPALPPSSNPEPSLYLVDTTLETEELVVGETGSVTATVSNTGDAAGEQELELTHEGAVLDTASVSVPAGERAEATLAVAFDEPGTYDLAVNGEPVGSVDVSEAQPDSANESDGNDSRNDTDDPADTASTGDGIPGFGVPAAIAALLAVGLLTRRQR